MATDCSPDVSSTAHIVAISSAAQTITRVYNVKTKKDENKVISPERTEGQIKKWARPFLAGNILYLFGGFLLPSLDVSEDVYSFDFERTEWRTLSAMRRPAIMFPLFLLGDFIYKVGGALDINFAEDTFPDVDRYCIADDTWERMENGPDNGAGQAACVLEHVVFISGGNHRVEIMTSIHKYDAADDDWIHIGDMLTARWTHAMYGHQGKLFMMGGQDEADRFMEVFDTVERSSTLLLRDCGPISSCSLRAIAVTATRVYVYDKVKDRFSVITLQTEKRTADNAENSSVAKNTSIVEDTSVIYIPIHIVNKAAVDSLVIVGSY